MRTPSHTLFVVQILILDPLQETPVANRVDPRLLQGLAAITFVAFCFKPREACFLDAILATLQPLFVATHPLGTNTFFDQDDATNASSLPSGRSSQRCRICSS